MSCVYIYLYIYIYTHTHTHKIMGVCITYTYVLHVCVCACGACDLLPELESPMIKILKRRLVGLVEMLEMRAIREKE